MGTYLSGWDLGLGLGLGLAETMIFSFSYFSILLTYCDIPFFLYTLSLCLPFAFAGFVCFVWCDMNLFVVLGDVLGGWSLYFGGLLDGIRDGLGGSLFPVVFLASLASQTSRYGFVARAHGN